MTIVRLVSANPDKENLATQTMVFKTSDVCSYISLEFKGQIQSIEVLFKSTQIYKFYPDNLTPESWENLICKLENEFSEVEE